MMGLTAWLSLPAAWPRLKSGWPGSNPDLLARLQKFQERAKNPNPDFDQALAHAGVERARAFIRGIKAYRHHPAKRTLGPAPVIWQAGTTLLRDYNPAALDAPPVFVVPSLINRFEILDLDRDHSFLRALSAAGLRPLLLDWGMPGAEEEKFTLTDYVTQRLAPALAFAAPQARIPLLGYCMGGLLALALAALQPERIRALLLLATPWDFHRPDSAIGPQFLALAAQMEAPMAALSHLPVDVIQSLFATFQPTQVMNKFADFAALDPSSPDARHFVLLEDWLNDGVPLAAPTARECLAGWYGENQPGRINWRVGDKLVDPRALAMPSYVVVPGKDRLVPPESARPLARLLPHATLHEPMTGHIGMIASRSAPQQVWAPLIHWLGQHA